VREIEWPPGSGRSAYYEPREEHVVVALTEQAERGEIDAATLRRQVDVIHDLKFLCDARLI
jgi:hypothetical protein